MNKKILSTQPSSSLVIHPTISLEVLSKRDRLLEKALTSLKPSDGGAAGARSFSASIVYAWQPEGEHDLLKYQTFAAAKRLAKLLEAAGFTVIFDQKDNLHTGEDIARFAEQVTSAKRIFVLGSPLLKAKSMDETKAIHHEMKLIEKKELMGRKNIVFPLVYRGDHATAFPEFMTKFPSTDIRKTDRDQINLFAAITKAGGLETHYRYESIRKQLEQALGESLSLPSGNRLSQWVAKGKVDLRKVRLVPEVRGFIGRSKELAKLKESLGLNPLSTQERQLTGLSGIGKSSIAYHFAHLHQDDYSLIWTINCKDKTTLFESLKKLAKCLGINSDNCLLEDLSEILKDFFETIQSDKPWLLIFSDVRETEILEKLIPSKGGLILTTSQYSGIQQPYKIPVFTEDESLEYLNEHNPAAVETVKSICRYVGHLPIALTIIRPILEMVDAEELLNQLEKEGVIWSSSEEVDLSKLDTVWNFAKEKVKQANKKAADTLDVCVVLEDELIPIDYLKELVNGDEFIKVIKPLFDWSFLSKEGNHYKIHPVVQKALRRQLDPETKDRIEKTLVAHTIDLCETRESLANLRTQILQMISITERIQDHVSTAKLYTALGRILGNDGSEFGMTNREHFALSIHLNPEYAPAYLYLAITFDQTDEVTIGGIRYGRRKLLLKAIELNPELAIDVARGYLHLAKSLPDDVSKIEIGGEALTKKELLEKALLLDPKSSEAYLQLSFTTAEKREEDSVEVITVNGTEYTKLGLLSKSIKYGPKNAQAYFEAANCIGSDSWLTFTSIEGREVERTRFKKDLLQEAIELKEDFAEAYNELGQCLEDSESISIGLFTYTKPDLFVRSIEYNSSAPEPYENLATYLEANGEENITLKEKIWNVAALRTEATQYRSIAIHLP